MDIDFAEEEKQQAEEDLIVEAASMAVMGAVNAVIEYGWALFDSRVRVSNSSTDRYLPCRKVPIAK